ncbi:hypothetical protein X560_1514 [Listeria fleischmannii 1991]|uniref:Uncharacterized beta-barrel protein ywiB n=2 Tax=Listeria fleischmannii TaxID=1069827 RepID=A0A2X3ILT5_9LIST|nr:DUF1934 family protein [Listeria fleischmannii]EMG27105.1 hypothetical protein LFLEISCH_12875 [Listeria fleischmannii subsp. fleischmannii LU2006-1]KMT59801.1 hypothetical protein X560_1514 [Listeria fleischmannii 1991]SQC62380.1 Uncharacterized beta-barrel protein ywiB [Listeria fleischmannii subsp. fleischmannii]
MAKTRTPVKIHITNIVRQMDAEEKTEMSVSGVFYQDEKSNYLQYEEKQMTGIIRSVLKISESELLLLRSGAVNMRLHFFKDQRRSVASVDSGAGKLAFESELIGYRETFCESPFSGKITFQYDLLSGGEFIGSYEVSMRIEEETNE